MHANMAKLTWHDASMVTNGESYGCNMWCLGCTHMVPFNGHINI